MTPEHRTSHRVGLLLLLGVFSLLCLFFGTGASARPAAPETGLVSRPLLGNSMQTTPPHAPPHALRRRSAP